MLKLWTFKILSVSHRLTFRAAFFALLAIASSLASVLFRSYVPDELGNLAGGKAVDGILTIMASSMLIVMTFALSTLVSAYSSATQVAPPRATTLIIHDSRSHSAISIFMGAFIYSIVSLIALSTGYYGVKGRVILLGITVAVLMAVIFVVIRWVENLKDMSSVSETIKRVEDAASKALAERVCNQTFGCNQFKTIPEGFKSFASKKIGNVKNIDIARLAKIAEANDFSIYIEHEVGAFLHLNSNLVHINKTDINADIIEDIRECFVIGRERTFNSDPRYGVTVLSEIAIKALSPSLNDPGTAVDIIDSIVRVLSLLDKINADHVIKEIRYPRLYFQTISIEDLFDDSFYALVNEAAVNIRVVKALQFAFLALAQLENSEIQEAVEKHKLILLNRALNHFTLKMDLDKIQI